MARNPSQPKRVKIEGDSVDDIVYALSKGRVAVAPGLGQFKVITVQRKRAYDITQNKTLPGTPYRKIKFIPSVALKAWINK